jgi:tripartite-type tricarboxylate transporter receptor subunit TctC
MPQQRFILKTISICVMALVAGTSNSQDYPSKSIRIVTSEPGGGLDFAARVIAHGLTGSLGQSVIVENRGGAGGVIAIETVAKAQPDGYTLLVFGSTIWLVPFLRDKVNYDPVRDFAPVTLAVSSPNIVVVNPSVAANSIKELIALAKAKPGALNYGSGALGASSHLSVELFKSIAGVNIVRVPYKGTGPALIGLSAGQVQVMFGTAGGSVPLIKAGKIRALAVTSPKPSAIFPDLPTVSASGLPGYESASLGTVFAPAKTPEARISRLQREIARYMQTPEAKDQLLKSNVEPIASTPQELAATMKNEMARLGKLIKDAGIREE